VNQYKKEAENSRILMIVCLFALVGVSASSYFWRDRQLEAECYPAKVRDNFPMISYMPAISTTFNSAKLYTFVVKYIELTKNQNLEQFKRGLSEETKNVATSESLLASITYSSGEEKKRNTLQYFKSQDLFSNLKKSGLSWRFNIEAIEYVHTLPSGKETVISVIGEYQVDDGDPNKASDLWGYRRLVFKVIQAAPLADSKGRWFNQDGLYVVDSYEENLTQEEFNKLTDVRFTIGFEVE